MKNLIVRFVREEAGQDLIEYALIATFVSLVASVGATALGTSLNSWYSAVSGQRRRPWQARRPASSSSVGRRVSVTLARAPHNSVDVI